jgi:uncharacterized protein (TIGR03435 family)
VKRVKAATCLMFFMGCAIAQSFERTGVTQTIKDRRQFDTVSIHESHPDSDGFSIQPNPYNLRLSGADITFLIQLAYGINPSEIHNVPASFKYKRFDINAKMDIDVAASTKVVPRSEEAERLLEQRLQAMLSDRFHLRVHKATFEQSILELTTSKRGTKLDRSSPGDGSMTQAWGFIKFASVGMDGLATTLSNLLRTTVRDRTGLTDSYAFNVRWDTQDPDAAAYPFSTLNDALTHQLGLKLVPAKASIPVLVVDSVTMPTPN